jgi:uncharacterized protein YdaU (DUF1376 family)
MADLPVMPLATDALLGDTSHLSAAEFGAYMRILIAMWRAGGSLPDDDARLARIAGMGAKQWRAAAPILRGFLSPCETGLTQKRLLKEWLKVAERSRKASSSAQARWLKNIATGDANADANAMRSECYPNRNTEREEDPIAQHSTAARATPPEPPSQPPAEPAVSADAALGDEIARIVGATDPRWAMAGAHVARWRAGGATPEHVRAAARGLRLRLDRSGKPPPNDPAYLDPIIAEVVAGRPPPKPPPSRDLAWSKLGRCPEIE